MQIWSFLLRRFKVQFLEHYSILPFWNEIIRHLQYKKVWFFFVLKRRRLIVHFSVEKKGGLHILTKKLRYHRTLKDLNRSGSKKLPETKKNWWPNRIYNWKRVININQQIVVVCVMICEICLAVVHFGNNDINT